jgi:hypothetical protein
MRQHFNAVNASVANPTAFLTINKGRIKQYNKTSKNPTYYLEKGSEFEIELFNPTKNVILCKIHLNSKPISQSGLVLNPGERVFLDRYLDVAKKFKFETYEVSNTKEVLKAIEDNGDFKVEFFNEEEKHYYCPPLPNQFYDYINTGNSSFYCGNTIPIIGGTYTTASVTYDNTLTPQSLTTHSLSNNTIETGRVSQGGTSNQIFQSSDKSFYFYPFHTIECKILPISQKLNTVKELTVKRYCSECGSKVKVEHKFCSTCGTKQ